MQADSEERLDVGEQTSAIELKSAMEQYENPWARSARQQTSEIAKTDRHGQASARVDFSC
jgi:hypothetical protein